MLSEETPANQDLPDLATVYEQRRRVVQQLLDAVQAVSDAEANLRSLVKLSRAMGIGPNDLIEITGLGRTTIYRWSRDES